MQMKSTYRYITRSNSGISINSKLHWKVPIDIACKIFSKKKFSIQLHLHNFFIVLLDCQYGFRSTEETIYEVTTTVCQLANPPKSNFLS